MRIKFNFYLKSVIHPKHVETNSYRITNFGNLSFGPKLKTGIIAISIEIFVCV